MSQSFILEALRGLETDVLGPVEGRVDHTCVIVDRLEEEKGHWWVAVDVELRRCV